MTNKSTEESFFDYKIHDINQLIEDEKIVVADEQDFSSVIFCFHGVKKSLMNHYARSKEKKYFYHYLTGFGLKVASTIALTLGLGLFSVSIVKGMLYDLSVSEMTLLEQKYQSKYNQLNEQKQDSNISTTTMKSVVQTVERIQKNYLRSPKEMMVLVSQDIALFPDMRINDLNWFIANSATAGEAGKQSVVSNNRRRSGGKENGLFEILLVKGELLNFDGDYRYALSVIDDLEASMKVGGKYHSIEVVQRPLNIQSNESITGDVSKRVNIKGSYGKAALFEIKVVREVKLDVK